MKRIALVLSLALLSVLTLATVSTAELGLKGIGGKVGLVMPEGEADNTFGLGVVADLGTITSQLRAEASADYWGDSWGIEPYEYSWSAITIGATVKYDFPLGGNITPFAGGGLGFTISRSKWDSPVISAYGLSTGGSTSSSDSDIGFHFLGGIDMPIGSNMKFTAEAKYAMDGADVLWLTGAILVALQ